MAVLNYSTTIAAEKTIGEIQKALAEVGAARIAVDYSDGRPSGVTFALETPHGMRLFTLPVNIDAMHLLLQRQYNDGRLKGGSKAKLTSREQAERVAWRVVKDWLRAQLTLIETRMATMDQVMLPYLHVGDGRTLYAAYQESETLALEAAGS